MFDNAREVVKVLGFRIRIDPSWYIIAALIIWSLSSTYFPQVLPERDRASLILFSVIAMVGLFASLVLHELAHSLVARHFKLNVGSITLFIFGGVAELERDPESAKSEFWIAIAGPIMSLLLGILFFALADLALNQKAASEILLYLGRINLMLATFNLIPAFPLDGGRVFRSVIWHIKNDVLVATRIASRVGTFFGILLIVMGILAFFASQIVAGMWQVLIGIFIVRVSQASYEDLIVRHTLKNHTVGTLMSPGPLVIEADETLKSLVENVILKHNLSFVPVVDHGKLLGYVDAAMIRTIDQDNWKETKVEDIFVSIDADNTVGIEAKTEDVFDQMVRTGNRKLLVMEHGELSGVISLADLMNFLAIRTSLGLPPASTSTKTGVKTVHA
ncbi:MAG: site-2 protease family protein [Rhizobiaceae bacterium]